MEKMYIHIIISNLSIYYYFINRIYRFPFNIKKNISEFLLQN